MRLLGRKNANSGRASASEDPSYRAGYDDAARRDRSADRPEMPQAASFHSR